ncbi:hypothetical protein EDD15DRAFT_437167 [Pisolithus albus]|nr:hypothetical protein EDD15DRAFT_437167 [Pisolithus albus]
MYSTRALWNSVFSAYSTNPTTSACLSPNQTTVFFIPIPRVCHCRSCEVLGHIRTCAFQTLLHRIHTSEARQNIRYRFLLTNDAKSFHLDIFEVLRLFHSGIYGYQKEFKETVITVSICTARNAESNPNVNVDTTHCWTDGGWQRKFSLAGGSDNGRTKS